MSIVKLSRQLFCLSLIALSGHHLMLEHLTNTTPPTDNWLRLWPLFIAFLYKTFVVTLASATVFNYRPRLSAMLLGYLILGWTIFRHIPLLLVNITEPGELNATGMALAIAGSTFIISDSIREHPRQKFEWILTASVKPLGKILLGLPLLTFGIQHFLYASFIATLVPTWIPGSYFWAIGTGLALMASGISIMLEWKNKSSSLLLGVMIWIWVAVVHVPRVLVDTFDGYEWTSLFQSMLIATGALVLYQNLSVRFTREKEKAREIGTSRAPSKTRRPWHARVPRPKV